VAFGAFLTAVLFSLGHIDRPARGASGLLGVRLCELAGGLK